MAFFLLVNIYNKIHFMAAGRYSFVIEQGATLNLELQYKDANGNPIDLTDYSGKMQIRPSIGSPVVYITLSSSLDADGTGLNLNSSTASSSPLSFDTGVYDLEIVSGSFISRILEGQVKLSPNVTL